MIRTGFILALALCTQGLSLELQGAAVQEGVRPPSGGFLISGQWLEENLDQPGLVVLQASSDGSDFQQEHIPGARLVLTDRIAWDGENGAGVEIRPFDELRWALADLGVSDGSTLVVYGASPLLAARLWMTLDVAGAGAGDPLFLDGGIQLWKEEGRPLTVETPPVRRGQLTLQPDSDKLATAEWILARLGHDDLALVDARPREEYTGADGGRGGTLNPGHIPNARPLYWERLIESPERPVFRPREELATMFRNAGADPSDTVVTYCLSGVRASVDYMVARMLGYKTRLFDGSWREWGSQDYPFFPRKATSTGAGSGDGGEMR